MSLFFCPVHQGLEHVSFHCQQAYLWNGVSASGAPIMSFTGQYQGQLPQSSLYTWGHSQYQAGAGAWPPQPPEEPESGGAGVGAKLPTIPPSLSGAAACVIPHEVPSGE